MNKKIFESYASIRAQIADLEEEKDKLEAKVLREMDKDGSDTVKREYGTFSRVVRKTWKYSDKVKKIAEDQKLYLGAAKRTEEENGTATAEEKVGLTFTQPKQ